MTSTPSKPNGPPARRRLERFSLFPAVTHLVIVGLDATNRALYVAHPLPDDTVGTLLDWPAWMALHVLAAGAVILSIVLDWHHRASLTLSGAVLTVWSSLMVVWGATLDPPVSLLGGSLGIVLGVIAFGAADGWAMRKE